MKNLLFLWAMLLAVSAVAQPNESQIRSNFLKNGTTNVKVGKIVKKWDSRKLKYYWNVDLDKFAPVPPSEVDGLAGVQIKTHVVANYDCNSSCVLTFSGVTYTEYIGINLPAPTNDELLRIAKDIGKTQPEKLFRSYTADKLGVDDVTIDNPEVEWIKPRALAYKVKVKFREQVNYTEVAQIEVPVKMYLKRNGLKAPWQFDGAIEGYEQRNELKRMPLSEGKNTVSSVAQTTPQPTQTPTTTTTQWQKGDKVMVEENGKWYPSVVLDVKPNQWYIHYEGYSSSYDLWIGLERIKGR